MFILDKVSDKWNSLSGAERGFGYLLVAFSMIYLVLFIFNLVSVCPDLKEDLESATEEVEKIVISDRYRNICRDAFDIIPIVAGATLLSLIIYSKRRAEEVDLNE